MTAVPFSNEIEEISMDGFQVVSGEYFTRRVAYFSPTCTIWSAGITFNKVALTALNNCERVRIEIHPQKKSVLLVPVTLKDKDGIPWRKNIKDYAPRRMECVKFSSKLYEMWGWDTGCVYRTAGRIVTVDNKVMLLFNFSSPEQWRGKEKKNGEMNGVHISFYLKTSRIHIFTETLRLIGCPKRICFLISADGQALLIRAHENRDLKSHKVPQDVYDGRRSFEISSWKLCKILADLHSWDLKHSYRIPGVLMRDRRSVRFSLAKAEVIGKESS